MKHADAPARASITTDLVAELILREVKPPFSRPTASANAELAKGLDELRLSVTRIRSTLPILVDHKEQASTSLKTLLASLDFLINHYRARIHGMDKGLAYFLVTPETKRSYLEDQIALLEAFNGLMGLKAKSHLLDQRDADFLLTWQGVALQIMRNFSATMQACNPDRELGTKGPLSRFISAMLPYVSGDKVKPETVTAFLKEAKRVGVSELWEKYSGKSRARKIPG